MIFDNISNIDKYQDDVKLYAALIALKHYVQGERYDETSVASFNRQECSTIPLEGAKLENHRKYMEEWKRPLNKWTLQTHIVNLCSITCKSI